MTLPKTSSDAGKTPRTDGAIEPELANDDALYIEFGKELVFAALGLKSQEAGTVAIFSIEIDGMKRDVCVSVANQEGVEK